MDTSMPQWKGYLDRMCDNEDGLNMFIVNFLLLIESPIVSNLCLINDQISLLVYKMENYVMFEKE